MPTTYTVNDRNQATYETTPYWHGYNANGNRVSRLDDGYQTVHDAYDDENRLVLAHFMNLLLDQWLDERVHLRRLVGRGQLCLSIRHRIHNT